MATRQYIGNRYVPLIFKNPDGTANWLSGVSYEALTIVTYANSSFTSRIPVPASVGAPNENPDYWAETGNYNEQVEKYRQEVQNLTNEFNSFQTETENRLDNIEKEISKQLVIIGDSYGVDESVGGQSWATLIKRAYNCYSSMVGGTGFASDYYMEQNFLSQLKSLSIPDRDKIEQIVIMGGANDGNLLNDETISETQLKIRIDEFMNYCATNFKNAIVKVAFVGWSRLNERFNAYVNCAAFYREETMKFKNGAYNGAGETIMHNNGFINRDDKIHPTGDASIHLAEFCSSMINNQAYRFVLNTNATLTAYSPWWIADNAKNACHFAENTCAITFIGQNTNNSFIQFTYGNTDNMTCKAGGVIELAEINNAPVGGPDPCFETIMVTTGVYGGDITRNIPFGLTVQGNKLMLKNLTGQDVELHVILLPTNTLNINLAVN